MNGLEFLNRHLKLGAVYQLGPVRKEECPSCQRYTLVEQKAPKVCADCTPLRRCFVPEKKGGGRFSLGTTILVTENDTEVWTTIFGQNVFPSAKVIANANLRDFVRRVAGLDGYVPPEPPFMVLSFAKAAAMATKLRVNYDRDWLEVSLNPLPGSGIETVHLAPVRDLLQENPTFNASDWRDAISLREGVRILKKSIERDAELRARLNPISKLPKHNSPEQKLLCMIA